LRQIAQPVVDLLVKTGRLSGERQPCNPRSTKYPRRGTGKPVLCRSYGNSRTLQLAGMDEFIIFACP